MYGICLDSANSSYSCYCIDGYTGINCEINWDDCWSDPCMNGGTCTDAVAAYNCTCPEGFIGTNCEQKYSECMNQPCLNNGTCIDYNGFTCQCQDGYSGDYCEIDISVCNSTICRNSGECVDGPGYSFICKCREGWTGEFCEEDVDECLSSPCLNGGLCLNIPASYTCACLFGFTGRDCDKAVVSCDVNPCLNSAMCLHEDGQPVCYCVPDYHGPLCELRYNDCESKFAKCQNGGTCIDGINAFTCSCPAPYAGAACEEVIPWSTSPPSTSAMTSTSTAKSANVTQGYEIKPATDAFSHVSTVLFDVGTSTRSFEGQSTTSRSYEGRSTRKSAIEGRSTVKSTLEGQSTTKSTLEGQSTTKSALEGQSTTKSTFEGRSDASVWKTTPTDFVTQSTFSTSSTLGPVGTPVGTSSTVFQVQSTTTGYDWAGGRNVTARELSTSTIASTSTFGVFSTISTLAADVAEAKGTTVRSGVISTSTSGGGGRDETTVSSGGGTDGVGMVTMVSVTRPVESTTKVYEGGVSTLEGEEVTRGVSFNCTQDGRNSTSCNCTALDGCSPFPSIKIAAFNGKSYVRQQVNVKHDGMLKIFLQLKTKSKSGIILHAFFDEERYVLLYVEFGQLKFQFSCGLQTMLLGEIDTPINNGHDVDVEIRFRYMVEDKVGKCLAKLFVNGTMAMSGEQMLAAREDIPGSVRLHLGGIPQAFSHYFPRIALGFIGCMGALRVNDVQRHFIHDSLETFQIEECTSFLCLLNPCRNFGSCHDIDGKVYCKCIAGYSGEMCEKTACDDNPCYFGATCISSPGTGFICVCPLGMHGLRCEEESTIVQPSFSVFIPGFSSYAAYGINTGIKDSMEFRMRILPHSVDQISLIAYMGQSSPGGDISDHFSVTYVRGFIMLTWDLGSGVRRIFTKTPLSSKAHRPHLLRVGRRGRDAWLFVDGLGNFTGQAAGTMTQLDVSPILYIGGHKSKNFETLPHDLPLHTGFAGCIYDVELQTDNQVFPVTKSSPASGRGVGECHRNECTRNACKNGAVCLNHGPTYSCICMKEWEGPECSIPSKPCPASNPSCHKLNI
ncbi:protein eyes shut [Diachasma alloeum]|uniref:protein eyes shut n=1 Tax=Diachasma alloeum TaxID=454923 RepID=UPI0007383303|nr:protein eyes shut [Diachasma alloeum]